jgi:hypothetical protein
MGKVYIAGDIGDPKVSLTRVIPYKDVKALAESFGHTVQLPEMDSALEAMEPVEFVSEVRKRISEAEFVVSFLSRRSSSPVVEAGIASELRKKQLILLRKYRKVPRMLSGLPAVWEVGKYADWRELLTRMFKEENDGPGRGAKRSPKRPMPAPLAKQPVGRMHLS